MPDFELRPEVAVFAGLMEGRLRLKDPLVASGRWTPWQEMEPEALLDEAKRRLDDVWAAFGADDGNGMLTEAVDAALFLMMFLDAMLGGKLAAKAAEEGRDGRD